MRGISGLSSLIKDYVESRDGRIHWFPHIYLFLDAVGRQKRVLNWKKEPFEEREDSATGRKFAIFKGRGAQCFHPDKWINLFLHFVHEGRKAYFVVPAKDCKACEFHEPSKRYGRRKYARCRWYRENSGLESPFAILQKSVEQAKEMIK